MTISHAGKTPRNSIFVIMWPWYRCGVTDDQLGNGNSSLLAQGWCIKGTETAYGEKPSEDVYSFLVVEITLRLTQWKLHFS